MKRKCSKCEEYLDISNFYRVRDNYFYKCKACVSEDNKIKYKKKPKKPSAVPFCRPCGETNPDMFHDSKHAKHGKQSLCKACRSKENMRRRLERELKIPREAKLNAIRFRFKRWCEYGGEFK